MWITFETDSIKKINLDSVETIEIKEDEILLYPPSRFKGDSRAFRLTKENGNFENVKEILKNL